MIVAAERRRRWVAGTWTGGRAEALSDERPLRCLCGSALLFELRCEFGGLLLERWRCAGCKRIDVARARLFADPRGRDERDGAQRPLTSGRRSEVGGLTGAIEGSQPALRCSKACRGCGRTLFTIASREAGRCPACRRGETAAAPRQEPDWRNGRSGRPVERRAPAQTRVQSARGTEVGKGKGKIGDPHEASRAASRRAMKARWRPRIDEIVEQARVHGSILATGQACGISDGSLNYAYTRGWPQGDDETREWARRLTDALHSSIGAVGKPGPKTPRSAKPAKTAKVEPAAPTPAEPAAPVNGAAAPAPRSPSRLESRAPEPHPALVRMQHSRQVLGIVGDLDNPLEPKAVMALLAWIETGEAPAA